ncbi:hypothetical protein X727_08945 [Mesorhizobium sp. L103C119B0]|uniref:hypothetical protein n=1 Tax=unclassified Mesorhizobium TaxID=325217 RepID=UPI0003D0339E|nr:hypothetical protein [Mesorhizobium sp. L103C119B0]ESZ71315.1 hypothetical protein X727_08945 [Mesorhizobium sp. L103C119B0]
MRAVALIAAVLGVAFLLLSGTIGHEAFVSTPRAGERQGSNQADMICSKAGNYAASPLPRSSAFEPLRPRSVAFAPAELDGKAFAEAVTRWNPDIFWAPASKSTDVITRSGDEARAVFGPIPEGDCGSPQMKVIPLEVDGNVVDLKPNPTKPGSPLEFEHSNENGEVVKWTATLPRCDKPSLTGSSTYCGLNSRAVRVVRGNVEWLFLCRKSNISHEVSTDPYWTRSDPRFSVFGTIGFNRKSGEIIFFDGRKDRSEFDWSKPFVPPGGRNYSDDIGRVAAEKIYDPTFQISCHACHDNKSPYVIDPHIEQSRVGFRSARDSKSTAFSLGDFLPRRPRLPGAPFRVVGSGYTGTYPNELSQARTVEDPTGNCTSCHTLTTQITGRRFAADAVGYEPAVTSPTWVQLLELHEEQTVYAGIEAHRTDWAIGSSGIHPWMVPGSGNDLSSGTPRLSLEDWRKLSDCLWGAGGPECGYRPLYTRCPAPEAQDEGSSLADAEIRVLPPPPGEDVRTRVLRLSWTFRNSYGGVPERDDIRINVAVSAGTIPANGDPPQSGEYPSIEQAKGISVEAISGPVGSAGSSLWIENVSFAGHKKWSDPAPSMSPRTFQIDLPGECNRRTLVRLVPKRFCFDQSQAAFSEADHLIYADVQCGEPQ